METLAQSADASPVTEPELHLLILPNPLSQWRLWQKPAAGSVLFHLVLLAVLFAFKESPYQPAPREYVLVRHITPLITPPDLTQKAPNKGPVKKELTLESIAPRPAIKSPSPAPAPKPAETAKPAPPPPPQPVAAPPKPTVAEPPKIEAQVP